MLDFAFRTAEYEVTLQPSNEEFTMSSSQSMMLINVSLNEVVPVKSESDTNMLKALDTFKCPNVLFIILQWFDIVELFDL